MKTTSWARRARIDAAARASLALPLCALALASGASCAGPKAPPPGVSAPSAGSEGRPVEFDFDSLDDRAVSADATRGEPTVIAFVTTASLPAQAQVDFLVAMSKNDGDRVHYAVVALEGHDARELVELYTRGLKTPFPVAMADAATLAGAGPFGDVSAVPVTVLLDRGGRVVWRVEGRVARSEEIRRALRGL